MSSASAPGAAIGGATLAIALSLGIYAAPSRLHGPFLYDDKAAIMRNPIVRQEVPWAEVWSRDFWGENRLDEAKSHKSWRPLVTLSYLANHHHGGLDPFGYHVVNAGTHALVSALVVPSTRAAFGWRARSSGGMANVAAALFAVHPVHVEATQNMVGRAELMMSAFFLCGFVAYANLVAARWNVLAILCTLAFTLAATLCKETGITLPALCAVWDVVVASGVRPQALAFSLFHRTIGALLLRPGLLVDQRRRRRLLLEGGVLPRATCARVVGLAVGAGGLCAWRLARNGGSAPQFNAYENPAALLPNRFFRAVSIAWVWLEYLHIVWWPAELSCDWSYPALPPIRHLFDARFYACAAGVAILLGFLWWACFCETPRPRTIMCTCFGVLPFALASNVFTTVGTAKAERLLYLPSLGGCMAAALFLGAVVARVEEDDDNEGKEVKEEGGCKDKGDSSARAYASSTPTTPRALLAAALAMLAVGVLGRQCSWYADVWCDGVALWGHALGVQEARVGTWLKGGATTHALAEYGMQLSWAGQHARAVEVLERQVALCEAENDSQMWPTAGRMNVAGYAPLSIVLRLTGQHERSIAVADRGISAIRRHQGAAKPAEREMATREAARCVAARALSVFTSDPNEGMQQMRLAVEMVSSSDVVVLSLAKQLDDYLAAHQHLLRPGAGGQ